jgi:hypothetical protein
VGGVQGTHGLVTFACQLRSQGTGVHQAVCIGQGAGGFNLASQRLGLA